MTKLNLFRLKNEMLLTNYIAIFLGACVAIFLTYRHVSPKAQEALDLVTRVAWFFEPFWLFLLLVLTLIYERPIRRYLDKHERLEPISTETTLKARQRLLNEPFFLIILDLTMWISAAMLYSLLLWISGAGRAAVYYTFTQSLQTGLITVVAAFFLLRSVLQRSLAHHFFPVGGLYLTPNTFRIRISMRLAALLFACNLVPFLAIINMLRETFYSNRDPALVFDQLRSEIFINSLTFMVAGVLLTILVTLNLRRPFQEIHKVLGAIRLGDFDQKVRVTSNDELGYTGDVINEMTEGLKERDRMRHSLELAKEVQQYFLPASDPKLDRLDIAGQSIYCDRTGGDYYDYLDMGDHHEGKISIVVGDVSGHGIPSALLMASARSSLRQRALSSGSIAQIVSDVNRQLTKDVEDSGRFMTLFCSQINTRSRSIRWVRAGHDPAIFYDPVTDSFEKLSGPGLALGVDPDWQYDEQQKIGLRNGQIIVIGTDGIWEAHNAAGETFGKESLLEIIRQHASVSAQEIVSAIIRAVNRFRHDLTPEDDVTLVVIKITG